MDEHKNISKSVLIVGAGPSGLMIAHELARFNIPVRLIDKNPEPSFESRALIIQIRTLEIFDALNIISSLEEKSESLNAFEVFVENKKPLEIQVMPTDSNFLRPLVVDQSHTEEVLGKSIKSLGVKIERGVELVGLTQTKTNIYADLKSSLGTEKAGPFAYIIGADGAHSFVRKNMPLSFEGSTYEDAFILADVQCSSDDQENKFRIFFKGLDFLALVPLYQKGNYRLISVRRDERSKIGPKPNIEEFQKLIAQLVPFSFAIKTTRWVSRFFVQCRSASHYQHENLFLIGDAAHIHSPAGGQGMNTGLQDAFNLGFKLALVLKKLSPESLLSTYELERKPVGDFLIKNTDRLFKFMIRSSFGARMLRRLVLPFIAHNKKIRAKIFRVVSQTAITYKHGCLCTNYQHQEIFNIKIGRRMINWLLINNYNNKNNIHRISAANFFTCFIFVPENYTKNNITKIYKTARDFADKYSDFLRLVVVFSHNHAAQEIGAHEEYNFFADTQVVPSFFEPFYIITRTDAHVFCASNLADLEHAHRALSRWYLREKP
jgi:2-polyprenyl-6-methoxyphenol hydroxylase-like FAD-dependent oxidoreductase